MTSAGDGVQIDPKNTSMFHNFENPLKNKSPQQLNIGTSQPGIPTGRPVQVDRLASLGRDLGITSLKVPSPPAPPISRLQNRDSHLKRPAARYERNPKDPFHSPDFHLK